MVASSIRIGIDTHFEEKRDQRIAAALRRQAERIAAKPERAMRVGASVEQRNDDIDVAVPDSKRKRGVALPAHHIDASALLDQSERFRAVSSLNRFVHGRARIRRRGLVAESRGSREQEKGQRDS